jgi:hypothetical protein
MFAFIRRWIGRREATSTAESREQARRALAWTQGLPLIEARTLAYQVVKNPYWFDCDPASPTAAIPEGLPLSVGDLYNRFRRISGLACDLILDVDELGPAAADPQFRRIGWAAEGVELCVRGDDDRLHKFPPSPQRRSVDVDSLPSVYHEIVSKAAMLGYVPIPDHPRAPD